MSHHLFTVAKAAPVNLNQRADELRREIDGFPAGKPLLTAAPLDAQSGVEEYLVVVRGHEEPHTHPDGDLIVVVLEGHGYFDLFPGRAEAPLGGVVVIPKGACHAFHNIAEHDTVLFATFSPKNTKGQCPTTTN
jgi:oxalate decarboxylase/phosphoglucose isomerase-like protein (cupin superfamily)